MNKKQLCIALVAIFAFVFVTDFIVHGKLLAQTYKETQNLWRTETEMQSFMFWMMLGQFMAALGLALIFPQGYKGKGVMEGIRYGIYMGIFGSAHCLIQYSVTPIPCSLALAWVITVFVQTIGSGIIASFIFKKA